MLEVNRISYNIPARRILSMSFYMGDGLTGEGEDIGYFSLLMYWPKYWLIYEIGILNVEKYMKGIYSLPI